MSNISGHGVPLRPSHRKDLLDERPSARVGPAIEERKSLTKTAGAAGIPLEIRALAEAWAREPAVDAERVRRVKEQLQTGSFEFDWGRTAEKLFQMEKQMAISLDSVSMSDKASLEGNER